MRGRRWIVIGVICLLTALLIVIVGVWLSISRFNLQQVVMPGSVEFKMDTPGPFYLTYEPRTNLNGTWYVSPVESRMTFELVSLDGAPDAIIEAPLVAANYSFIGRHGHYIGKAELDAGLWRLTGSTPPGDDHSGVYAFGRTSITAVVIPVLAAAFAAALLGPVGLGLLIVGIILHVHGRKRARRASQPPPEG